MLWLPAGDGPGSFRNAADSVDEEGEGGKISSVFSQPTLFAAVGLREP
jgi:hypothetical protein